MVIASHGNQIRCTDPNSIPFNLISNGQLGSHRIRSVLARTTASNNIQRHRIRVPIGHDIFPSSGNQKLRTKRSVPSGVLCLHIHVNSVNSSLCTVFVGSVSRRHQFRTIQHSFIAGISRRLGAPTNTVSLLTRAIASTTSSPSTIHCFSNHVSGRSTHLARLIHHLVSLRGTRSSRNDIVSIGHVSTLTMTHTTVGSGRIRTSTHCVSVHLGIGNGPIPVSTNRNSSRPDRARLVVVTSTSTVRATIGGLIRGTVRCSPRRAAITINIKRHSNGIAVHIISRNVNVPRGSLSHIFRQFCHISPTHSQRANNSNLNLTVAGRYIRRGNNQVSI